MSMGAYIINLYLTLKCPYVTLFFCSTLTLGQALTLALESMLKLLNRVCSLLC